MAAPSRSHWHPVVLDSGGSAVPAPSADELVATTAHELRLPLSHIKGFVTSLRRTDVTWDEETRREFLAAIDLETDRLADLIDCLLRPRAADRGDALATDLAWTDPTTVLQGALHRLRGLLGAHPLQLDLPPSLPSMRMQPGQLERVLVNLIQNAIKYSPSDTAIGVSARITDGCELEFAVEDEGPGIPAEDRERIFDPFFRQPTTEQAQVPGHGLGLAICRSIVGVGYVMPRPEGEAAA